MSRFGVVLAIVVASAAGFAFGQTAAPAVGARPDAAVRRWIVPPTVAQCAAEPQRVDRNAGRTCSPYGECMSACTAGGDGCGLVCMNRPVSGPCRPDYYSPMRECVAHLQRPTAAQCATLPETVRIRSYVACNPRDDCRANGTSIGGGGFCNSLPTFGYCDTDPTTTFSPRGDCNAKVPAPITRQLPGATATPVR